LCRPLQTYKKSGPEWWVAFNVFIWSDDSSGGGGRRDLQTEGSCTRSLGIDFLEMLIV